MSKRVSRGAVKRSAFLQRAFTLLEVLVTTSIISLLIALATSGIRGAFATAKSSACSSNLRHMGVAAHMYAATNRGSFLFKRRVPFVPWRGILKAPKAAQPSLVP